MNTRYGADVLNQPEIHIINPAEGSHISPYICRFASSSIWLYHNILRRLIFMEKYKYDDGNGLWYELQGNYYIPCLNAHVR